MSSLSSVVSVSSSEPLLPAEQVSLSKQTSYDKILGVFTESISDPHLDGPNVLQKVQAAPPRKDPKAALIDALESGDLNLAERLLESVTDVGTLLNRPEFKSIFIDCSKRGHTTDIEIIDMLIKKISTKTKWDWIWRACENRPHPRTLSYFLDSPDIDTESLKPVLALMIGLPSNLTVPAGQEDDPAIRKLWTDNLKKLGEVVGDFSEWVRLIDHNRIGMALSSRIPASEPEAFERRAWGWIATNWDSLKPGLNAEKEYCSLCNFARELKCWTIVKNILQYTNTGGRHQAGKKLLVRILDTEKKWMENTSLLFPVQDRPFALEILGKQSLGRKEAIDQTIRLCPDEEQRIFVLEILAASLFISRTSDKLAAMEWMSGPGKKDLNAFLGSDHTPGRVEILDILRQLPVNERTEIITQTSCLTSDYTPRRVEILDILRQLSVNERTEIVTQVSRFTKMFRVPVLQILLGIPSEERDAIVEQALRFDLSDRARALEILQHIPLAERASIVDQSLKFDPPNRTLEILQHIPFEKREAIIKQALRFDPSDRVCALEILQHIPLEQNTAIVGQALKFDPPDRVGALEILQHIPSEERTAIIEQALTFDLSNHVRALKILQEQIPLPQYMHPEPSLPEYLHPEQEAFGLHHIPFPPYMYSKEEAFSEVTNVRNERLS